MLRIHVNGGPRYLEEGGCLDRLLEDLGLASRLLVGTGKYRNAEETAAALEASGTEVVTFAVRRTDLGQGNDEPTLPDGCPVTTGRKPPRHRPGVSVKYFHSLLPPMRR